MTTHYDPDTEKPLEEKKPEEKISTVLVYMPLHHDADETVVDGVTFKAYEPFDVGERRTDLAKKLASNPWFSAGEVDADRKATWEKVRKAQKESAAQSEAARRLAADPTGELAKRETADKKVVASDPQPQQPQPRAARGALGQQERL
jgi:hypothetical protein